MAQRFSRRTAWDAGESAWARAVREARAAGKPLVDLTLSNPTLCGFEYDDEAILAALGDRGAMRYDPDPRGMRKAREAVATYYGEHSATLDPDHVLLTTSTSEAYSFLFRLMCDAGDTILVAQPSYPLFDFVAGLDDVRLESYPLFYDFGWHIDFAELERRIVPTTRALVLVHPNNPTGHATTAEDLARLQAICAAKGLALIVDEVFLDYGLRRKVESAARSEAPCLTFVVSGLSKIAALPQMKVGWIVCLGPELARKEGLTRLEIIADTYLSMNAPAQLALPRWLAGAGAMRGQILGRVRENVAVAGGLRGVELLPVEAGWSAVLRLPWFRAEEDVAVTLVREAGVVVHPGEFYGMGSGRFVVVSTLGDVEGFGKGMNLLAEWSESKRLTLGGLG